MGRKILLYISGVRGNRMQTWYANLANNTSIEIPITNREDNSQSGDNLSKLEKFTSSGIKRKVDSLESKEGDN